MKISIIFAYLLAILLLGWAFISRDGEFIIYGATTVFLVLLLHWGDRKIGFVSWTLWAFNAWLISHIMGGLFHIGETVLYSQMIYEIVDEPYSILKYDQIVHAFCYFVMTALLYQVLKKNAGDGASERAIVFFSVLAAVGVGGLNEIVEFAATVLIADVNVGGYENTAIDIVANTIGALIAVPFLKRLA